MAYHIYVYRDSDGNPLYVGRSEDILVRIKQHKSDSWSHEVGQITCAECKTGGDMCIYEAYYINRLQPKYNGADKYRDGVTVTLPDLTFEPYIESHFKSPKATSSKPAPKRYTPEERFHRDYPLQEGDRFLEPDAQTELLSWFTDGNWQVRFWFGENLLIRAYSYDQIGQPHKEFLSRVCKRAQFVDERLRIQLTTEEIDNCEQIIYDLTSVSYELHSPDRWFYCHIFGFFEGVLSIYGWDDLQVYFNDEFIHVANAATASDSPISKA